MWTFSVTDCGAGTACAEPAARTSCSPTANSGSGLGTTNVTYTVSNLGSGQPVMFDVLAVIAAQAGSTPSASAFLTPSNGVFSRIFSCFQIPATKPELRNTVSTL